MKNKMLVLNNKTAHNRTGKIRQKPELFLPCEFEIATDGKVITTQLHEYEPGDEFYTIPMTLLLSN